MTDNIHRLRETARPTPRRIRANELDDSVAEGIAIAINQIVDRRIAALEERIKQFTFTGPWSEDQKYKRGNFASCGGAVYYCSVDAPIARPGQSDEWTLAVPRARDGRDGKDFTPPPVPEKRIAKTVRQNGPR